MSPEGVGISLSQLAPDAVAEITVVTASGIAGDGVPVQKLRVIRAIFTAGQCLRQRLERSRPRCGAALFQAGVGLAKREKIEKVLGRRGIDVAAMFPAPMIEDDDRGQPYDVQVPNVGVPVIEAQGDKRRIDRGGHGAVWIHHGIQQLTPDSLVLFDVNEKEPSLPPGAADRILPGTLPANRLRPGVFGHLRPMLFVPVRKTSSIRPISLDETGSAPLSRYRSGMSSERQYRNQD